MASGEGGPSFESTPSWIIGAVAFVMVGVSLGIEKLLTHLGHKLKKNGKTPLYEALQKIKDELMLMGFVSLLLVVVEDNIKHWCIPQNLAHNWRPCHSRHRLLDENDVTSSCSKGKVPFIALGVLHDLHYLIFILAVVHVFICTLTVLLGEAKLSQWLKWEEYIRIQRELHNDHADEVIDLRSSTFIKERFQGVDAKKRNYVFSFIKHLGGMVTRADYEAMRLGFILTHGHGNQRFNFHRYMVHAYEADFKKVVSISWFLWLFAVISLALNVAGWNIYFWLSFIPLVLLLVVGTKLEQVMAELAIYIAQRHTVIIGEVQIQPSDDYFWFRRPKIIHMTIHVILFTNSFGFSIFFWTLFKFGFNSCVMGDPKYVISRLVIMVVVQTICSYSTLPLYAIVTQMGSSYNKEAMLRCSYEATQSQSTRIPEHTFGEPSAKMGDD